jgi:hypothetical protein
LNVWIMTGAVRQESRAIATVPDPGWVLQGVGDTNWDGRPEIFLRHPSSGLVSTWVVNALVVVQKTAPGAIDPAWRLVGPR